MEVRFAAHYFTFFLAIGVLGPYFQKVLDIQGFHEQAIGYILAAFNATGCIVSFLAGMLVDRHPRSRRFLMPLLALGMAASFMMFQWITAFGMALCMGIVLGFFFWPVAPMLDGLALHSNAQHGNDYGRPRSVGSIAFIAAILVLEYLGVDKGGEGCIRLLVSGVWLCCLLFIATSLLLPLSGRGRAAPHEQRHGQGEGSFEWRVFLNRRFMVFMAIVFFTRLSMAGYYSYFTLYLQKEIGFQKAGYLWCLATLCEVPVIFFSSRLVRWIGVKHLFSLGGLAIVLRLAGMSVAPSIYWIIPLQLLHALTFGAFFSASIHYVNRIVPRRMKQSATASLAAVTFGLSSIVGSPVAGELVHRLGYRWMYGIFSMIAIVALCVHLICIKEPESTRKREVEACR